MAGVARSVSPGGALLDAAGMATAGSCAPALIDVRGSAALEGAGGTPGRRAHLQPEAEEPLPSPAPGAADHRLRCCGWRVQGADVLHLHRDARRYAGALFGMGVTRFRPGRRRPED